MPDSAQSLPQPALPGPILQGAKLSVVVPCFDEADVLPALKMRLTSSLDKLGLDWEIIGVDDGSSDATYKLLREMHEADPRFKVLALSRNFGHQAAISAGLAAANGDYVAVMDADLQDPPELIGRARMHSDET